MAYFPLLVVILAGINQQNTPPILICHTPDLSITPAANKNSDNFISLCDKFSIDESELAKWRKLMLTCLKTATQNNSHACIEYIRTQGLLSPVTDEQANDLLLAAVQKNNIPMMHYWMRKKTTKQIVDAAAKEARVRLTTFRRRDNSPPETRKVCEPLRQAIINDNAAIVTLLLTNGYRDKSLCRLALTQGNRKVIQLMLETHLFFSKYKKEVSLLFDGVTADLLEHKKLYEKYEGVAVIELLITTGDIDKIKQYWDRDAAKFDGQVDLPHLMQLACRCGQGEISNFLHQQGAVLDAGESGKMLLEASLSGDKSIIVALLSAGMPLVDLFTNDGDKQSAAFNLIYKGNVGFLLEIIDLRKDELNDSIIRSIIELACIFDSVDLITMTDDSHLLSRAFLTAIARDRVKICTHLISHGMPVPSTECCAALFFMSLAHQNDRLFDALVAQGYLTCAGTFGGALTTQSTDPTMADDYRPAQTVSGDSRVNDVIFNQILARPRVAIIKKMLDGGMQLSREQKRDLISLAVKYNRGDLFSLLLSEKLVLPAAISYCLKKGHDKFAARMVVHFSDKQLNFPVFIKALTLSVEKDLGLTLEALMKHYYDYYLLSTGEKSAAEIQVVLNQALAHALLNKNSPQVNTLLARVQIHNKDNACLRSLAQCYQHPDEETLDTTELLYRVLAQSHFVVYGHLIEILNQDKKVAEVASERSFFSTSNDFSYWKVLLDFSHKFQNITIALNCLKCHPGLDRNTSQRVGGQLMRLACTLGDTELLAHLHDRAVSVARDELLSCAVMGPQLAVISQVLSYGNDASDNYAGLIKDLSESNQWSILAKRQLAVSTISIMVDIPVILQNATFERREIPQPCPLLHRNGTTITQS